MKDLTRRQREVFEFVRAFKDQQGMPPTLREIASHFGFGSPTAAAAHLQALRQKGYLDRKPRQARGSRIVNRTTRRLGSPPARIPVYSTLPSDSWSSSAEGFNGWFTLDPRTLGIANRDCLFAFCVEGDSLSHWHIIHGDLLIMERGCSPAIGQIVAVLEENRPKLIEFAGGPRVMSHLQPQDSILAINSAAPREVLAVMVGLIRMGPAGAKRSVASELPRPPLLRSGVR